MFAVSFVILGGIAFFLALSGVYTIDPWVFGGTVTGLMLLFGLAFWFLNSIATESALNSGLFRFWKKDLDANKLDWEPKKIRNYKKDELGTNAPPTRESLEELGMGNSTWVPKGKTPQRKKGSQNQPRRKTR
ncbi:hypothetical protein Pla110_41600 [Polystyrenella longa]|uniref:Uncharacterized protein n=2 Tax=Polystyrenella longa TaxID=2528007 RepID=A0A518CT70_9PLAN|nr:hypothetical protein Pla110_41600 [Polystyrenella longa]